MDRGAFGLPADWPCVCPSPRLVSALGGLWLRPGGRRRVGEADHQLQSAVACEHCDVRALDIERRLGGAAGDPTEPYIVVMRFDAAREAEPIAREMSLSRGDHAVEAIVTGAVACAVD